MHMDRFARLCEPAQASATTLCADIATAKGRKIEA
jgi:hypothetical protein